MAKKITFDSIDDALKDIKAGKVIIVVDDEDRENEGDFICAAELVTPGIINFMATYGKGLICVALPESRCDKLNLPLMVGENTALHQTQFTISVDLKGKGCTTGISAYDRAKTIKALVSPDTRPRDLARPGHIFPLRAKNKGVLKRSGHTEAAVDLSVMAGLKAGGVLVEIMNADGSMARLPQLIKIAKKFNLKIISIKDIIAYRLKTDSLTIRGDEVKLPTAYGDFRLIPFKQKSDGLEHIALIKGSWKKNETVLVRVHSSCVTGDIFGSYRCDCGPQLHKAMQMIDKAGKGVLLYMNQEGRGIGLFNKIRAYKLQEQGRDTVQANVELGFKPDERDYGVGAGILRELGITRMRLITNNPVKRAGLEGYGIKIVENVKLQVGVNKHNFFYLQTKQQKMGHFLELVESTKRKNTKNMK